MRLFTFLTLTAACVALPCRAANVSQAETLLESAYILDTASVETRDAAAVIDAYETAAAAGDAFALLRLGYLYEKGDGIKADGARAKAYYEQAAARGLSEARVYLALCYLSGTGTPKDTAAFVQQLTLGAEQGNTSAQKILADVYYYGIYAPKDSARGLEWKKRAAAGDDIRAQTDLGRWAAEGLAMMRDLNTARSWYGTAAKAEYTEAMNGAAKTFLLTKKSERNWQLGREWLELSVESGDIEAPLTLAICELLHVDQLNPDRAQAVRWIQVAAERGNDRAVEILDAIENKKLSPADAIRAVLNSRVEDRYVERTRRKVESEATSTSQKPVPLLMTQPVFPDSLKILGQTGEATVEFIVDEEGNVSEAWSTKATHPLFAESGVNAAKKFRFKPAVRDGKTVKARLSLTFQFHLDAKEIQGMDGALKTARFYAKKKGGQAAQDTEDLRWGVPLQRMKIEVDPTLPPGSGAIVLLVLDETGKPIRGHLLHSVPENRGDYAMTLAMSARYQPLIIDGNAQQSNVVITVPFAPTDEQSPIRYFDRATATTKGGGM